MTGKRSMFLGQKPLNFKEFFEREKKKEPSVTGLPNYVCEYEKYLKEFYLGVLHEVLFQNEDAYLKKELRKTLGVKIVN